MASSNEVPRHLASNPFEDLSGVSTSTFSNPYDALIIASENDPKKLQERYEAHRTARNIQQKAKLLDPGFSGVIVDPILYRLENPSVEPGYVDPRHCLVFWARPPQSVKALINDIQTQLLQAAPNLWLMPSENLHMTAMEITHSKTEEEIAALVEQIQPRVEQIVNHAYSSIEKRARLIKPMIGFDAAALALSFVPAAGEALTEGRKASQDEFTYHHLRRDAFAMCEEAGVKVDSRYIVPSAHLTIGRFVNKLDFETDGNVDQGKVSNLVELIENTNADLHRNFWPKEGKIEAGGEWIVGREKGFVLRRDAVWYGGGRSVMEGKAF
ncbi:hypothetical protein EJ08DRAFT_682861 [Tothia fuscella]|uniref:RNA ligase/cyclic nucleotide phosphodiesterase n=1 Tax=Tothia fuscella TaxID=1048955 RepID=A0A9P4NHM2_9PEZI|nr:hypothetical protein EJ08DRAFT_682861 [Tothia fuscella]